MKTQKHIGSLLLAGAIGVLIPYTILTITFNYPDILRQETGMILTKFHEGGSSLIFTWWAFAVLGLPLLLAYKKIGQLLESKFGFAGWETTLGITGLIVQMIGLLRWTFVVPVLADNYIKGDAMTQTASKIAFQVVHQYGGVVLGEHLGQLFTIIWTVMMTIAFDRMKFVPKWVTYLGYISSAIYLMAQAELFATVIPGFPVWGLAGFIGSTLWLVWLMVIGTRFCRKEV
ncbi:DUF4386 domain-containing protein [Flavobacterium sp. 3HN19-14]|uniref:DUF4386 domain-containing protein n=1 Tax=Flavobacterium sp. 3HN19-14 TaxID=3448133 RepID=UPI003EE246EE